MALVKYVCRMDRQKPIISHDLFLIINYLDGQKNCTKRHLQSIKASVGTKLWMVEVIVEAAGHATSPRVWRRDSERERDGGDCHLLQKLPC